MSNTRQAADFVRDSAAVRRRAELAVVHVTGDDRRDWLNGQLTNDVRHTKPGESVYALAVTVRGKIMADAWLLDDDGRLTLLVPASSLDTLLASFDAQIIMEDVELQLAPELSVLSVQGPKAAAICANVPSAYPADELGTGGILIVAPRGELDALEARLVLAAEAQQGGGIDEAQWELARIRATRPRFVTDFDDKNYPQEAGLGARAVSFQKGCYLGQEVICTLESRGRLSRQLVRLVRSADTAFEAGADVLDGEGQIVGRVTSCAVDTAEQRALALAYVKRAHAAPGVEMKVGSAAAQVDRIVGE